jgi:RNA polymerase sigma-70 factor, ECF subfamily
MSDKGFLSWVTRLVLLHRRDLLGIARHQGLAAEDALDAVQQAFVTFLRLPHARALTDEEEDSRKLLTVLVRNEARNGRRRHHRSRPHLGAPAAIEELDAGAPSVEALITAAEAHVTALGCIDRLGEVQARVVTLRLLDELPGEAVAEQLGLTANHVAVLLHRAKQQLRECIDERA